MKRRLDDFAMLVCLWLFIIESWILATGLGLMTSYYRAGRLDEFWQLNEMPIPALRWIDAYVENFQIFVFVWLGLCYVFGVFKRLEQQDHGEIDHPRR